MPKPFELLSRLLRGVFMPALRRVPLLRGLVSRVLDLFYRVALLPFGRRHGKGEARESADLVARTDELNRAAERYFAEYQDPDFILDKPFSEDQHFPKRLFDMGVLFEGLRLRPGAVVAELGAGTCWLSHFLNRYGCPTASIDVSETALDLGRRLFERDPRTDWSLEPRFLVYDGHRLPLEDASCDRVVINDAFHHIPNQREILTEMARILRSDGIVGMCEPGRGHSDTEASRREVETTGVLENEIVVEDLAALAVECGFRHATVMLASPLALREIPAAHLGAFMRGLGFTDFWENFCGALDHGHYIFLYKGERKPTTRQPRALAARISVRRRDRKLRIGRGEAARLRARLVNVGDTRWLAGPDLEAGWTRLGIHLYRAGRPAELLDWDWYRADLPQDLRPGKGVKLDLELPALSEPGSYRLVFDLVVENLTWFAERGSETVEVDLEVSG